MLTTISAICIINAFFSSAYASNNIVLTNHKGTRKWWVAFAISHEDLTCGGTISKVEISDNAHYQNIWVNWSIQTFKSDAWKYEQECHFDVLNDQTFTAPLSVRISKTDNGEIEVLPSMDVITNLTNTSLEFDFGTNFCLNTHSTSFVHSTVAPTLFDSTSATSSSTEVVYTRKETIETTAYDGHDSNAGDSDDSFISIVAVVAAVLVIVVVVVICWRLGLINFKPSPAAYQIEMKPKEQPAEPGNLDRKRLSSISNVQKEVNVQCEDNRDLDEQTQVKHWLEEFKMEHYYDLFMENGMTSLEYIKRIETGQDLHGIGIMLKGHQIVIMAEINQLKQQIDKDGEGNEVGEGEGVTTSHTVGDAKR